ncbi:flagellar basal-body rod modification protein FlgD [Bacillus tianshenii]|uniref:Basal-body rod modification protein FlgD n=1 Tax=Sutcliffiella tianshenii TaxID=1463404 RepID=A0ABS2NWZ2_9BACI|nr:flagellar hook assembly protein FlgD [Bacillus tianshenii]MBM7618992.1 flagellar basal-body rod modification protein FlgD [Bacillus tianshenii]
MTMTSVSSDLYIQNRQVESKKQNNVLGKDDFLRLLMAQLQNQDPMNPMEDREFIAQMATFSSLEQMTNLNKSMEGFIKSQNKQQALAMQQYLGSEVTWQEVYYVDEEPFVETKTGTVTSISMNEGNAKLITNDGSEISLEQLVKVTQPDESIQNNSTLLQASHLIDKKVSLLFNGKNYENLIVNSVVSKGGKTFLIVDDPSLVNEKIPLDAITKISQ